MKGGVAVEEIAHEATIVTGPSTYPISVANAKAFSGVQDDDLAAQLIASSCAYFSARTGHQLTSVTFSQKWDYFDDELLLDWAPIQSVSWVKYYDTDGTLTTLSTADYWTTLLKRPPRIIPAVNVTWPDVQDGRPEAVEVQYVAGYASYSTIDAGIIRALYGLISLWAKLPEPLVWAGGIPKDIPHSLCALMGLHSYRGYR